MSRNGARPKKGKHQRKDGTTFDSTHSDHQAHKLHRDIIDFEEFRSTVLASIRRDLKAGMTPKQLREKYAALVQARALSDALTNENPTVASPIIKDVLDRVEGKAVERKETTHRFKEMSDKELDAVLQSEEEDLKEMQNRFDQ